MNPNLIKVFKASNPDKPLYADQGQINANPEVLIKWDNRDAWLKSKAAGGSKQAAAKGKQSPGGNAGGSEAEGEAETEPKTDDADTKSEAPPQKTKAELQAELDAKGIPYTKKMTVEQLESLLADNK